MPIKCFCKECGKEIFPNMDEEMKETTTVAELERSCICTDCELKEVKK